MESTSTGPGSLIGATLGGYEVIALIGRGAMGTVYLARDLKLNRLVALKVLLGTLAKTKSLVEQFHKEAQAAAPLNHPGIVRVYSAGTERGIPYIVMEYVDGEPLDKFLKRKGKMKWEVALHICRKMAQALEVAHRNGIVHRDIKPANIMLDKKGGVRLMDFGIATLQTDNAGTGGHSFLGTPQYMSPEQARNDEVDASSDLYSLGITIYQLISGTMPFSAESSLALINAICNDEAPRLNINNSDIPDDVARFVAYLMGKTPRQRPANAKVVSGMVARLLRQKGELNSTTNTMTEFIQTEMEVSPFASLHQKPVQYTPPKTKKEIQEKRDKIRHAYQTVLRVVLIVLAGFFAYVLGTHSGSTPSLEASRSVPVVDALNIHKLDTARTLLELNRPHYTVSDLHWLGIDGILWLELNGEVGSMGHGTVGAIGVDLIDGQSYAVAPLQSPLLSAQVDDVYLNSIEQVSFAQPPDSNTRATDFLFAASDAEHNDVVVLSRPWDKAYPHPRTLLRIPRSSWVWRDQDDPITQHYGNAMMHPRGESIVYTLYDPEHKFSYLSEQVIGGIDHPYRNAGLRKTSQSNHIIPGTVQFAPKTNDLVYWRKRSGIGAELWRLHDGTNDLNGDRIISGVVGDDYALSPDGTTIAVQHDNGQGTPPQLVLIQLDTGLITARLGEGSVSRCAWHPTQPYLIIAQPIFYQGALNPQLVAIDLNNPEERTTLTQLEHGVGADYAFSPDGQRLAVVVQESAFPSVLVLNWIQLEFKLKR